MSASRASGHAYARASARGVLLGLLLSAVLVVPFAISAADSTSTPEPTPAATTTVEPTAEPNPTTSPTAQPTEAPIAQPTDAPTAQPTDAPTAQPTDAPTATPTPSATPVDSPVTTPDPSLSAVTSLLITFGTNEAFAGRAALFASLGLVEEQSIPALRMASVTGGSTAASAAVTTLRMTAGVARVESEAERTIEATPDDTLFATQWALPRIGWTSVYGGEAPSGTAVVAVLDTGIDGSQPDLAGLLVPGAAFTGAAAPDTDPNGHGTAMAGIVAARVNNATGVAGVAFAGVSLMPVTVLGADGTGADANIIAGIVWAVDHGADVILMSFSSPTYSPSLQAAIDYAWAHDVVLVAATGNDGSAAVTYPAGDRGVMGVSNTDENDSLNTGSNYGDDTFLAAPGTDIATTASGGSYTTVTGTSASAAMVAGTAGLLRAFDPAASNGQVVYRLAVTAADVAPVDQVGNGRLDLAAALAQTGSDFAQPAGAGVFGPGGPILAPYVAAACAWTGASSMAWEDTGNWSGCTGVGGLPGAADSVSIPSTANAPTISVSTGTASVRDLSITAGVTLTMTGGTLEIWHDWKPAGTFNGTGGTVQFRGSGGGGPTFAASNQFYDIVVDAGVDPGFDNTAASVINISHDFTNNNATLSAGTAGTFVFNGTEAQSIYSAVTGTAATFGNLTVNKPSGTLTLTSNANVTGLLTITSGTLDLAIFTANRASNGNGLTMASGTLLRVGGASGPTGYTTSTLDAASTVEYYGGAQTVTALNYGNLTLDNGDTKTAAAALTINGTLLVDTSTTFAAGAFNHNYKGSITNNGTFATTSGTANVNGTTDQTIGGSNPPQFVNVTVSKATGTAFLAVSISVTGNLNVANGTLDLGAYTADRSAAGGTLTIAAGDTLMIGGSGTWPANYTTNSLNSASTVEYYGAAQAVAGVTYGHLTLSGSGTKTATAGITVAGDFTISAGVTFAAGSYTHSFGANFTNDGTFSPETSTAVFTSGAGVIGGSTQTTFGAISITNGVISTAQSLSAASLTFTNNAAANSLTLGSGTTMTVNGNVTINQSAATVIHAWNVNAGTAVVTGNVTINVTSSTSGRVAKVAITTGSLTVQGDVIMSNTLLAADSIIDMSGGAGTLNLGGALTLSTLGTLTPGTTSTVVYNGTGAQTVTFTSAVTYNNLTIDKPSGTATLGAAVTTSNLNNLTLAQGTLSTNNLAMAIDGTWTNNGGTLSGGTSTVTFTGTTPVITGTGSTDFPAVSIAAAAVVAMNNSNTATSLTFAVTGAAQSLTQATGTSFTVSGAVTMNQPSGSFTSAWNINGATATTNGLITFAGTNTTAARVAKIVITTGTLNANAGITFVGSVAAGKVIDMSGGAGTLNLKGALTVPALSSTLTAGTAGSTFVYADTNAQTINYFTAGAYHNLSVSNSSASGATLSAAISTSNVTGNLRVLTGGTLNASTFAITGTASRTLEVQDGGTLRLGGTTAFPTGFSTVVLGGAADNSTIDFYGGAQNVAATATLGTNYDKIIFSGSAVTKTLLGNMTADSLLTINSSATFAVSNRTVAVGSLTGNGTIALGSGGTANTFTVGSDGTSTTFSGVFSSTNDATDSIAKTGAGTLTLSGTSTYTGSIKSSAGAINVTGTLAATSALSPDAGTISGSGTTGIVSSTANGGTVSPGNPASSAGILNTKNTTLNSSTTFTAQLNGTTAGTNYDQLNVTGTVSLASATLSLSLGYAPTVGDTYTIIANDSTDAITGTFNGQAQGSTITVSGVSMTVSYTGGTGNDVTLTVASITDTWTGASGNNWSTPGNWQDNRAPTAGHVLIFPSGATSFTPNNDLAAGTSFAAITISGSGYTIGGNSITLGANNLTASNASGANTISLAIALSADRTVTVTNSAATLTLGGAVSGAFNMTKAGSGTLVLNASNSYVNSTISAGTLQVGNGSTTGTLGSGSVADNGALVFNRSNALTVNNTISGSGAVSQSGAGTTTLGGANSYSGATTIAAGTLSISADNNLGTAPGSPTAGQLVFSGGTLATSATFTLNANRGASFTSTATIDVASSTTLTYNGIAAGASGFTKTSSGTLVLGGANSYSGATTVSVGTLRQGAVNSIPSGSALTVVTSATFDLNSNNATVGSLAGGGAVTLGAATLASGGDNTSTAYSGTLSGTGGLTKNGSGTLDLGSATITVGALAISAGVITAPGAGKTFSVSGAWTNNASTSGLSANTGTVSFDGSSTQAIGGSFVTTFKNASVNNANGLSLSVGMTVNGTLTLAGGNITTAANTLYIANGGSVSRTSGQVVGNLKKYIATGTPTVTFEIGSASAYTPVSLTFASVSVAGDLTAITSASDHPSIAGSLLNGAKDANRYWTLTNSGISFTTFTITSTFVAGDLDAGASATSFFMDRYSGGSWSSPRTTSATATTTTATLISAFGDFVTGESLVPVPGSLAASAISTRRVDLSWLDNASTETGYVVEKGTDGVNYSAYTTTAANATGQSVTGLSASTTYYFRVRTVTASSYSPYVYITMATLSVPVAVADSYSTYESVILGISAPGLLSNDPDGTNGFFTTTKATDPAHGSVTVNSDGSFVYTPTSGYTGSDSFTYRVNDGALQSSPATVTLTVLTTAYVSAANWPASADSSKYIEMAFPAYLPSGATVYGATLHNTYRSNTSAYTVCYYIEVYESTTLIATHGSAGSPVSCSTGTAYLADNIALPEVNTASRANNLKVRLIVWSSGGGKSEHRYADVTVDYQLN